MGNRWGPSFETIVLEKIRFFAQHHLSRAALTQVQDLDFVAESTAFGLTVTMRGAILGKQADRVTENVHRTTEVVAREPVPVSWWDHLKQEVMVWRAWLLMWPHWTPEQRAWLDAHRCSVRYRSITTRQETAIHHHHVAVTRVCPHLELPGQSQQSCVAWLRDVQRDEALMRPI